MQVTPLSLPQDQPWNLHLKTHMVPTIVMDLGTTAGQ